MLLHSVHEEVISGRYIGAVNSAPMIMRPSASRSTLSAPMSRSDSFQEDAWGASGCRETGRAHSGSTPASSPGQRGAVLAASFALESPAGNSGGPVEGYAEWVWLWNQSGVPLEYFLADNAKPSCSRASSLISDHIEHFMESDASVLPNNALVPLHPACDSGGASTGLQGMYVLSGQGSHTRTHAPPRPQRYDGGIAPSTDVGRAWTENGEEGSSVGTGRFGSSAPLQLHLRIPGLHSALQGPFPLTRRRTTTMMSSADVVIPFRGGSSDSPRAASRRASSSPQEIRPGFALVLQHAVMPPSARAGGGFCTALRSNVQLVNSSSLDILVAVIGDHAENNDQVISSSVSASHMSETAAVGGSGASVHRAEGLSFEATRPKVIKCLAPGKSVWLPVSLLMGCFTHPEEPGQSREGRHAPKLVVQPVRPFNTLARNSDLDVGYGSAGGPGASGEWIDSGAWSEPVDVVELAAAHTLVANRIGSSDALGSARKLLTCRHSSSSSMQPKQSPLGSHTATVVGPGMLHACLIIDAHPLSEGHGWEVSLLPPAILRNQLPVPIQVSLTSGHMGSQR